MCSSDLRQDHLGPGRHRRLRPEHHHARQRKTVGSLRRTRFVPSTRSMWPAIRCDSDNSLLSDWRTVEFQSMTRGGVRTEKLWMNFDSGFVHWHSYAGRNFTDRQRIKRKAERWATKFRQLPGAERLGSGLINCKNQESWLVVLREDAMSQLFCLSAEQLERIKPFFPRSHDIIGIFFRQRCCSHFLTIVKMLLLIINSQR